MEKTTLTLDEGIKLFRKALKLRVGGLEKQRELKLTLDHLKRCKKNKEVEKGEIFLKRRFDL